MNDKKILWITLVILAGVGSIVFFPFLFEGNSTCLFHYLIHQDQNTHSGAGGEIVRYYVSHFGYFWWGSLFLASLAIYHLVKAKKKKIN